MCGRCRAGGSAIRSSCATWSREVTAFAVLAYAVVLVVGVVRLAQGEAAWNGWLAALRSPGSIAAARGAAGRDGRCMRSSWFEIMPKTMPMMLRRRRAPGRRRPSRAPAGRRRGGRLAGAARARPGGWQVMKRSNAPIFWLLFGAGGMLSALFGTALVFITGIAVPLGWPLRPDLHELPAHAGLRAELARQGLPASPSSRCSPGMPRTASTTACTTSASARRLRQAGVLRHRAGDHARRRRQPAVDRVLSFASGGPGARLAPVLLVAPWR